MKDVLGLWMSENEGAKFWLGNLTELKNRGMNDMLIACTDNLSGMSEAIAAVYPKTEHQLCIVHRVPSMVQTKEMKGAPTNKTFKLDSLRQMLAA